MLRTRYATVGDVFGEQRVSLLRHCYLAVNDYAYVVMLFELALHIECDENKA